jgi:hypothetical protein
MSKLLDMRAPRAHGKVEKLEEKRSKRSTAHNTAVNSGVLYLNTTTDGLCAFG